MASNQQQYQKFEDEAEDAQKQAEIMTKQGQEVLVKGVQQAQEGAKQAQHYAEVGQKKFEENKEKIMVYEKKAEKKYEEGAEYVVKHSKILRVLAALFMFPIWFPFYQLLHTGLRSWDICVNVEQRLSSTFKKFMFFIFMLFMGCGITQTILAIFAFIHLFDNCKVLQESPSSLDGMHSMVYEQKCSAAEKIEQTLLLIFGDYQITASQQKQINDIENQAAQIKKQVDTVANMNSNPTMNGNINDQIPKQSPGIKQ